MKNKNVKKETVENKYWEAEEGELIKFGKKFMRCYDTAGKLQLGYFVNTADGEKFVVQFVLDRKELNDSAEGLEYLQETLREWKEV